MLALSHHTHTITFPFLVLSTSLDISRGSSSRRVSGKIDRSTTVTSNYVIGSKSASSSALLDVITFR